MVVVVDVHAALATGNLRVAGWVGQRKVEQLVAFVGNEVVQDLNVDGLRQRTTGRERQGARSGGKILARDRAAVDGGKVDTHRVADLEAFTSTATVPAPSLTVTASLIQTLAANISRGWSDSKTNRRLRIRFTGLGFVFGPISVLSLVIQTLTQAIKDKRMIQPYCLRIRLVRCCHFWPGVGNCLQIITGCQPSVHSQNVYAGDFQQNSVVPNVSRTR